jgi:hypothetical protein
MKIDMNSLVEQSHFGTVRITIGCMDKQSQVTYYNEAGENKIIRGSSSEICDHINSLPTTKTKQTTKDDYE